MYTDQITVMQMQQGTTKSQLKTIFGDDIKVKSFHTGSKSKLSWCHITFPSTDAAEVGMGIDSKVLGSRAYKHYRAKISVWQFNSLRPAWVKDPTQQTCVCWRCKNASMLWDTCKQNQHIYCGTTENTSITSTAPNERVHRVGTNEETIPLCDELGDEIERANLRSVIDGVQYGSTINDFLSGRLCPRDADGDDSYFHLNCIKGVCDKCDGLDSLEDTYVLNDACPKAKEMINHRCYTLRHTYTEKQRAERLAAGKTASKSQVSTKVTETHKEFVHRLMRTCKTYAKHKHLANWQSKRADYLRKTLPKDSIMSEWDFAENYSFWHSVEIQQEYW